uniref:glutathione transferase n=1 Tax=Malurus cyaneus samueli TaxID=2593467 RepID=A0A8C5TFZ0_9PASS
LFQQVPMVEIDGMKMVQTRAIANYISTKYNLYGKDLKERALYCTSRMFDLNETPPCNVSLALKIQLYHGKDFLVGNQLSRASAILEIILMEKMEACILLNFLSCSFKARICNIPTIKKFLQPGSQRKPPSGDDVIAQVMEIFYS